MSTEKSTSLNKALLVLETLSRLEKRGSIVTVTELVEATGLDKAQISRMLSTFVSRNFVERLDKRRGYRLGWGLFHMASQARISRLGNTLRPLVDSIGQALDESIYFSVLSGTRGVTLLSWEPERRLYVKNWEGDLFSLMESAVGNVLLSDHDSDYLEMVYRTSIEPDHRFSIEQLRDGIRQAREDGFSVVENERQVGVSTIAVPVRATLSKSTPELVGTISTSIPLERFEEAKARGTELLKESASVAQRMLEEGSVRAEIR